MAKARRAQPRPARVVVPIIVIVVVLAVIGVAWRLSTDSTAASGVTSPSSSVGAGDGSTGASASVASESPSGTSSAGSPTTSSSAAAAELKSCRAKVGAGDDVIKAASTGVGHWSEHVQAQTDQFDGKISTADMQAIFARTRLAGPDDVSRYDDAAATWDDESGTCATRDDASTADNAQLSFCGQRLTAMKPVMSAGADGMKDWAQHLSDMRHSRMVHVDNAEQIWLDAWKAAPPHIKAFDKADTTFEDAPDC